MASRPSWAEIPGGSGVGECNKKNDVSRIQQGHSGAAAVRPKVPFTRVILAGRNFRPSWTKFSSAILRTKLPHLFQLQQELTLDRNKTAVAGIKLASVNWAQK